MVTIPDGALRGDCGASVSSDCIIVNGVVRLFFHEWMVITREERYRLIRSFQIILRLIILPAASTNGLKEPLTLLSGEWFPDSEP